MELTATTSTAIGIGSGTNTSNSPRTLPTPPLEDRDRPVSAPPAPIVSVRRPLRSLGEAAKAAGAAGPNELQPDRVGSDTPSEEDYDQNVRPTLTSEGLRRRMRSTADGDRPGILRSDSGVHITPEDDRLMQEFLARSSERADDSSKATFHRQGQFSDLVFTQQFSAFDRNNLESAQSPFHGFYNLFWLAVTLFVFKISAENWRAYGNPLGSNEIMKTMFSRDGKSRSYMMDSQTTHIMQQQSLFF